MKYFYLISSIIAGAFLVYSIMNRNKPNISLWHPRILVEFSLMIGFLILGLLQ